MTLDRERVHVVQVEERARGRATNMGYVEAFENGWIQDPHLGGLDPYPAPSDTNPALSRTHIHLGCAALRDNCSQKAAGSGKSGIPRHAARASHVGLMHPECHAQYSLILAS
ncbi:hypothetical protein GCM10009767_01410 [Kocuria aegyptia]|uniref:Uncharacterized protein n=1 Tax=Kocuria aegyptia TaxID=330943 RepID=A0ABN2K1L1_9MICC